jgi:hypothetical protein
MKTVLGVLGVLVLLGAITPIMATADVYNDGYRQGSHDYIHGFIGSLVENPTNNPNIIDFVNGHTQAWNDIFNGPWATAHFTKNEMQRADGWFAGANALAYNLTKDPMGHNSDSYVQGWYSARYPSN